MPSQLGSNPPRRPLSVVYPEPGMVVPRLKRELNAFLGVWLRNLKAQGHRLISERD